MLFSRPSSTFTASPSFQVGRQSAAVRACHGLVLGDRCGMRRVMKTVASWRNALMSEDMHFVACHRWHKSHRGHRCWSVPSPSRCFATPTLRVRQQSRLPLRVHKRTHALQHNHKQKRPPRAAVSPKCDHQDFADAAQTEKTRIAVAARDADSART